MLKNHKFFLNITWLILMFTVPLPLIISVSQGLVGFERTEVMAINMGIFAYSWMLSAIYLASKPKWLDRLIGLPDMYLIHGVMTIFALALMYVHKFLLPSGGWIETTGEFSLYLITAIIAYSLIFLAGWLTKRVAILEKIKNFLEKIFKHEISIWLHRLNLVAVIVIYIHIYLIDYIREIKLFFFLVTIYTVVSFTSYFWYLINKNIDSPIGKVHNVRMVDSNIVELSIKASKKSLEAIKAGDFAYISFPNHKGLKEAHPFSILNVPSEDGYFQMAIEGVGDFTKELQKVKQGEKVNITRGHGILYDLVEKSNKDEKFVLLAGGIGVVPLLALAEKFDNKNITFLYTVSKDKGLLYPEKFSQWNTRENFTSYCQQGRFSPEQLDNNIPIGEEYSYIIAGPMTMNVAYSKYLKAKGIASNKMYYEGFNF